MTLPKRFINLVGTVIVLGVLAAGVLLVALPVYLGSFDVDAQRATVTESNNLRATQIQNLAAQQARLPELEAELGDLRRQIPATAAMDAVSRLAVSAAAQAGVKLTSFDIGETGSFAPPAGTVTDGEAKPAAAPPTADGAPAAPAAAASADTRQQTRVTITVETSSVADGTRFIDELRQGSRLLQIMQTVTNSPTDPGEPIVTVVNALAFTQP